MTIEHFFLLPLLSQFSDSKLPSYITSIQKILSKGPNSF